ncbi:MAG TPA: multidrug effflux MFS transporter [Herpetosiphonaceae bacterium]
MVSKPERPGESTPIVEQRTPSYRRLAFVIGALSAFGPLSMDMYLPSLPALSSELGASASQGQLTLTACLVGLALGQVVAGPLSDTWGRRRPLLVGLVMYTVASLLCALAPSVSILIALRLVQGIAGSAGIVIARAVVRDLYAGEAMARFFSLTMLVSGLAPILAPVIGGQLLLVTNWRGVFVVLSGIGAGLVAMGFLGLPESLPAERRRRGSLTTTLKTFRYLLTDRALVGYGLSSGLALAAMFAYIAGSPFVLEGLYGMSPQSFSLTFATNALGIVAASQLSGRLTGKIPLRRLMALGLAVGCTGGLLLLAAVLTNLGLIGILPALFLVVASIGLITPPSGALALAEHPREAGSASALLGVLQYLLGGAVAPVVGRVGVGTALPLAIIIVLCHIGAVATFVLLAKPRLSTAPGSVVRQSTE